MSESWEVIGNIIVENQKLKMPNIPTDAGLYRLTFDDGSLYIGEAKDISRRLGDYVTYYPSVGIESEYRINLKLMSSQKGTEVAIMRAPTYEDHAARCVKEHQEIKLARAAGATVLNGGKLEERIAFHESEIVRLRKTLELRAKLERSKAGDAGT